LCRSWELRWSPTSFDATTPSIRSRTSCSKSPSPRYPYSFLSLLAAVQHTCGMWGLMLLLAATLPPPLTAEPTTTTGARSRSSGDTISRRRGGPSVAWSFADGAALPSNPSKLWDPALFDSSVLRALRAANPAKKHPFRGSILTAMRLLQVKKVTPEVQLFSWQQKEFGRAQLNRLRPPHLEDFEVRTPLLPAAAPAAVREGEPLGESELNRDVAWAGEHD